MLRELHISNLAVIEDATIEFDAGLNVFTGQTGAGKSLVIGAFEMLLGLRSATDMLRPGADEGRVSGVFEVSDAGVAAEVSRLLDQSIAEGEGLLITRKLHASGRTSVSVNGMPATAAMVKQVGQLLVDIHGQHDHQYLLRPSNQLVILDAFARCGDDRLRFGDALAKLRELRDRREELGASRTLRRQQLELYEFQADEIDAADPQLGEFPELQARHDVLSNVQRIKRDAGQAHAALYEAEGSISERLQVVTHLLLELAAIDPELGDIADGVRSATLSLQESAFELGRYVDRLEHDPAELAEVEDRLNALNRLVSKYGDPKIGGDDPVEQLLTYRAQIGEEITRLRGQDDDLSHMDTEMASLRKELQAVGERLRAARTRAAAELRPLIESQLRQLGMGEARFDVRFEPVTLDSPDLPASGLDLVEMVVETNPGQDFKPLRKIASGGELSRIMLAIKSILAGSDRVSVLVFDEIDANIGGRLGSIIGEKLRELANGGTLNARNNGRGKKGGKTQPPSSSHQVLCITHLPQIAAFANRHLRIEKSVGGGGKGKQRETRTTVVALEGKARVEELAEMMAGKDATATTRKQAEELLAAAGG